jgi:hypothetical protein
MRVLGTCDVELLTRVSQGSLDKVPSFSTLFGLVAVDTKVLKENINNKQLLDHDFQALVQS